MQSRLVLLIFLLVISCATSEKKKPRALIGTSEPIEEFSAYGYIVKAYENRNYEPEDWLYRFECADKYGKKREFALRTKIIQKRQFYLSEKLTGGWENIAYFDARPNYPVVKAKLIEILSRGESKRDSLINEGR